ncbi:Asp-tRNA(Asn)/Glu-tRNA(Gln) amidotransferase subunit GatB [Spiroplasma endosymbiont of Virgichneumon dumeticola]|uniref:Asp-tRNA(Asn)/Glu-tRNA(Gln) amidotransferase subunit GatB n=1 Tax=Spiroplasma endosymbiont of Virgichneumon dumeticola TaxID=3139323 RepID=UPI0035C8C4E8
MNNYDVVMGIEIHCELKTKTKCFSSAPNTFGEKPNSQTSAIDCGFPGTLPAINQAVIVSAVQTCSGLNMNIDTLVRFDRKSYFYPDLPKGYQITQFYHPIGRNGYLKILVDEQPFTVEFERLHIEEDTAKQIHHHGETLLDYNRAGIPLLEIVTKPVFTTSNQVVAYINALRQLLIHLKVSDAKMNEGSLRCDINISLKAAGSEVLGTKVEIKNLNSTNNITLAINDEIIRQSQILDNKQKVLLETRRFDEKNGKTILMRSKENNIDYKYFPEPNIFPIQLDEKWVKTIIKNLPELPKALEERLEKQYKLNKADINILLDKIEILNIFEETVKINNLPIPTVKCLLGLVQAYFNSNNINIENTKLTPGNLAELVVLINDQKINDKQSKELLTIIMTNNEKSPNVLIKTLGMSLISDGQVLTDILLPLLTEYESTTILYEDKPERVMKFFMGQLMKITKGSANPQIAQEILKKLLDNYKP